MVMLNLIQMYFPCECINRIPFQQLNKINDEGQSWMIDILSARERAKSFIRTEIDELSARNARLSIILTLKFYGTSAWRSKFW